MKRRIKRLLNASKTKLIVYIIISLVFCVSFILFVSSLIKLEGIENIIRIIIIFILSLYLIFHLCKGYNLVLIKRKAKFIILNIFSLIISIILLLASYYIDIIYNTLGNLEESKLISYTGYLITLNDTTNIDNVGMINNEDDIEGYKIANAIIKDNKLKYKINNYNTYEDMLYDLYNKEIDGAFVQSNYITYFSDIYNNIKDDTKIIYKKSIKDRNINTIASSGKTLEEPFTVLLLGVDSTTNDINTSNSFNGDTLMLITFNPKTLNATVFSIPRDLYVPISCRNDSKAKINSSSAGGVSCVIDTIKELTDIDIDYYAKINFKGVVDLVEALKGIDVYVTYPFCEQDSDRNFDDMICLKEGYQHLNGEQALAYARHRHTLPTGDLQRIQNQQLIVEAMSKKLLSLNTVTEFKDILAAISNNIVTNLSRKEILSSYEILKNMLLNVVSQKEALAIEKAYLEVYDLKVYNKNGTYSAALGYHESSLNDIIKMMKVNLELEREEEVKEFTFDANSPYEAKVAGKGLKDTVDVTKVPDFVGKNFDEALSWGNANNIIIQKELVTSDNENYNNEVSPGLIGKQSISPNTVLSNITEITVYINNDDIISNEDNTD